MCRLKHRQTHAYATVVRTIRSASYLLWAKRWWFASCISTRNATNHDPKKDNKLTHMLRWECWFYDLLGLWFLSRLCSPCCSLASCFCCVSDELNCVFGTGCGCNAGLHTVWWAASFRSVVLDCRLVRPVDQLFLTLCGNEACWSALNMNMRLSFAPSVLKLPGSKWVRFPPNSWDSLVNSTCLRIRWNMSLKRSSSNQKWDDYSNAVGKRLRVKC